ESAPAAGACTATFAVRRTVSPYCVDVRSAVMVVLVSPFDTWWKVGDDALWAKLPVATYNVTIWWDPGSSAESVREALPFCSGTGSVEVPSTTKVIVPVGVPAAEVTVAVTVHGSPNFVVVVVGPRVVLVAATAVR